MGLGSCISWGARESLSASTYSQGSQGAPWGTLGGIHWRDMAMGDMPWSTHCGGHVIPSHPQQAWLPSLPGSQTHAPQLASPWWGSCSAETFAIATVLPISL